MNLQTLSHHELRSAAEFSVNFSYTQCARREIVRRFVANELPDVDAYDDVRDEADDNAEAAAALASLEDSLDATDAKHDEELQNRYNDGYDAARKEFEL